MSTATEDDKHAHEEASLVGRPNKEVEPTCWETYVGHIREYLLNFRPFAIAALVLVLVFGLAWFAVYCWGMTIWTGIHKDCKRPLDQWLGFEGIIGVLNTAILFAIAGLSFKQTYGTRPTQMPEAPSYFVGLVTFYLVWCTLHFAWFVVGTSWVFQLGPPRVQHVSTTATCDEQLYLFTWWVITIGWGWYVLLAMTGCALSACLPPPKRADGMKDIRAP